jgi:hypothetical protein
MTSQSPNINDIFNRINMGMSQRSKILSGLNRPSTTTTNTPSTTATTTSTAKGKSFSSLTSKPTNQSHSQTTPTAAANADADLKTSYLLPPNAGVGFAPTPSASSATAEQKALRERLAKVGWKGGKRGEKDGGKGRKRAVEESESEEELGRSAVGTSRGNGKRVRSEDGGGLSAGVEGGEGETKGAEVPASAEGGKEDVEMVTVAVDTPVSGSGEMIQPDGEGKA